MNATESQIRAEQIVRGLYARGVNLYVEDGEIRYKSSLAGTVTNDDLVDLDENKVALIAFLLLRKQGFSETLQRLHISEGGKQGMPDNVVPFPAPRGGRETDEALDNRTAAMADCEGPGDEAG